MRRTVGDVFADFLEVRVDAADEPIEKIQEIRERPPDFVTAPPLIDWYSIAPADAVDVDLAERLDITAPRNETGERCPWPWEPQQLVGVPLGQYHCQYCGAMVLAGVPHIDYWPLDHVDGARTVNLPSSADQR